MLCTCSSKITFKKNRQNKDNTTSMLYSCLSCGNKFEINLSEVAKLLNLDKIINNYKILFLGNEPKLKDNWGIITSIGFSDLEKYEYPINYVEKYPLVLTAVFDNAIEIKFDTTANLIAQAILSKHIRKI